MCGLPWKVGGQHIQHLTVSKGTSQESVTTCHAHRKFHKRTSHLTVLEGVFYDGYDSDMIAVSLLIILDKQQFA
jgi:hypothetical protein